MATRLRLLFADDNPDDRPRVLRELGLEFPGLEADHVTKTSSLARALAGDPFDLVIIDDQLQWTDGLSVLRAVKDRWPDCPVIMLIETGGEEIAVAAMKTGLDNYILKSPRYVIRLSAVMRSALEQTRQRRVLKEAEARYRTLFDGVPVGLYRTTPLGQFLDANLALAQMLGCPDREAVLAVNPADLYASPLGRQQWQTLMEREGVVRGFEVQFRRSDGEIIWVRSNARVVRDAAGEVLYYEGSLEDITERKRIEEALRRSEEVYRLVFDQSPVGVFHYDTQLHVTDCNDRFAAILQSTRERLVSVDTQALRDQSVLPALRKATEGEMGLYEGFYRATTSAAEVWVSLRTAPLFDQKGHILGGVGIVEDLTERKRAEDALAAHTRQLEAVRAVTAEITRELDPRALLELITRRSVELVGAGSGAVHLWDESTQVVIPQAWHGKLDEWQTTVRYRPGEGVVGTVALRRQGLIVNDYRTSAYAHPLFIDRTKISAVLAEPLLYQNRLLGVIAITRGECEPSFTAQDRELLTFFATQAAIAIENARLYQTAQRELTERKQAEEVLAARTRQLEAVRAVSAEITRELDLTILLQLITRRATELVGAAGGMVRLWDEATQLLVSRAWYGVAEWLAERVLRLGEGVAGTVAQRREGMIVNDFRTSIYATPLHLERTRHNALLAEPMLYRDRLVGVILLISGEPGRPFTAEDREILSLFAAEAAIAIENARLFAELNRSYEALQQAQEELVRSEKLQALGQMAAGIAHDLNNMLAAILGQVELLRLQTPDPGIRERLATLETAATDGAHVVRRLQGFARQQPSGPLTACDLATVVQETVEFTRPRWKDEPQRRGVVIQVRTALADCPPILGHAPEIREALTNLILNAVDAMPQGGTLTIAGHPTPGWVELTVADTGLGMTEETRRRIFDPFFTTKGGQGTGLGLSVVYGIMERHGGYIAVASTPGQGATFTLRFRPAQAAAPESPARPARPGPSRRLLLIDDDPVVRSTVASLLRAAGHTVTEAEGGAAGIACLTEQPVDLILTDLGMPEVTGWDVARAVKAQTPWVPIVLLTGWGDRLPEEPTSGPLVDRVLGKPFRLEQILAVVAELTKAE